MKIIRWFIDTFAIGALMITSIFSVLVLMLLVVSIVFNFSPFFTNQNGGGFGLVGYQKGGIPMEADVSAQLPDSSILIKGEKNSSLSYKSYTNSFASPINNAINYSDTIITQLNTYDETTNHFKVIGASIEKGTVYLRPSTITQKLILNIPMMLKLLILSYSCWQLGMLLSFINSGDSFKPVNYKRLRKVGWSIVILYLCLFVYNIILNYNSNIWVDFSSTIENYREPFHLNFQGNVSLNISWLVTGCIFIILSLAFEKGNNLQQEQDLTV